MELLQASACVILTVLHAVSAQTTDTPPNTTFLEELTSTSNSSALFSTDGDTLTTESTETNCSVVKDNTVWPNFTDSSLNQSITTMLPSTDTSKITVSSATSTSTQAQINSSVKVITNTTPRTDSTTAKGGSATLIGGMYWMVLSAVALCFL